MKVIIQHRDGREYQIESADFRRAKLATVDGEPATYADAGFEIIGGPNGEVYTPPAQARAQATAPDSKKD